MGYSVVRKRDRSIASNFLSPRCRSRDISIQRISGFLLCWGWLDGPKGQTASIRLSQPSGASPDPPWLCRSFCCFNFACSGSDAIRSPRDHRCLNPLRLDPRDAFASPTQTALNPRYQSSTFSVDNSVEELVRKGQPCTLY